jgi:hypothetical protein
MLRIPIQQMPDALPAYAAAKALFMIGDVTAPVHAGMSKGMLGCLPDDVGMTKRSLRESEMRQGSKRLF